jgi:hypothetical protein
VVYPVSATSHNGTLIDLHQEVIEMGVSSREDWSSDIKLTLANREKSETLESGDLLYTEPETNAQSSGRMRQFRDRN